MLVERHRSGFTIFHRPCFWRYADCPAAICVQHISAAQLSNFSSASTCIGAYPRNPSFCSLNGSVRHTLDCQRGTKDQSSFLICEVLAVACANRSLSRDEDTLKWVS